MTDLIKDLKNSAQWNDCEGCGNATDEIERLRHLIDEGNATFATWKANYDQLERELAALRDWVYLHDEGLLAEFDRVEAATSDSGDERND